MGAWKKVCWSELFMNVNYLSPTVRAMLLLDAAGDNLQAAIDVALTNAREKDIGCDRYWIAVADALTLRDQEN